MAIDERVDQDAAVRTISGWYESWKDARSDKEEIWNETIANYLVKINESKYQGWPWRSKVADTFSQEIADSIVSEMRNAMFPINEQYMRLEGLDDQSRPFAPTMQQLVERQQRYAGLIERVMPFLKQLGVIGNSPFLMRWGPLMRVTKRRMRVIDPRTRQQRIVVREGEPPVREGLLFETLDAFDTVMDPAAVSQFDTPILWELELPLEAVGRIPRLENLDELEEVASKKPTEYSDTLKQQRQQAFGLQEEAAEPKPEPVKLLFAWGDLVIDGQRFENHVAVIGNRQVLLRFEDNGFWAGRNVYWAGYDPMWLSAYEKGPLEPVRGVHELINTFSNQKVDILNLIINPGFKYVDDGVINPEELFSAPGWAIQMRDINNLDPLAPNGNVALTYTEIEQLRQRGERSSGSSRFDMGAAPGGRRTAFEANLIRAGGSTRSNDVIRHVANGPMEYFVNFAVQSTQQFAWSNRLTPKQRDTFLGWYYAHFIGADVTIVRQVELQNQMLALDLVTRSPTAEAAVNMPNLLRKLFRNLMMDDPTLINDDQTFQRNLRQLQRQASRQAGPQAEGQPGGRDERLRSLVGNMAGAA